MQDTVTVSRELLRQVFDALRQCEFTTPPVQRKIVADAKDALRAALKQPAPAERTVQEPVLFDDHEAMRVFLDAKAGSEKPVGTLRGLRAVVAWWESIPTSSLASLRKPAPVQEQEPVAEVVCLRSGGNAGVSTRIVEIDDPHRERLQAGTKLYTAPVSDSVYKRELDVWLDKTEWVQKTVQTHELGMHRADVLRQRIEAAQPRKAVKLTGEEVGMLTVFDGLGHVETPLLAEFIRAIEQAVWVKLGVTE